VVVPHKLAQGTVTTAAVTRVRSSAEPILFKSLSDTGEVQFVRAGFPFVLARLHVEP